MFLPFSLDKKPLLRENSLESSIVATQGGLGIMSLPGLVKGVQKTQSLCMFSTAAILCGSGF